MRKIIIIILSSIFLLVNLYSQEKRFSNIWELANILKDTAHNKSEENKDLQREFWFLSTRYDNNGQINGYVNAVKDFYQKKKLSESQQKKSLLSLEDYITWNYLGPKGLSFSGNLYQNRGSIGRGWINKIAVISEDTIYAGARNSGLWCTTDSGNNWVNISETEPLINGIYSILIDPDDTDHIIVLTRRNTAGELADYSNGIFETFNHGQNWSTIEVEINGESVLPTAWDWEFPVKLIHKPDDFDDLFLITNASLLRKSGQNNWEQIYRSNKWGVWNTDIMFDKNNNNVFYIGGSLVFKMTITQQGITSENITDSITGIANDTIVKCMIGSADNYPNKIWFYYYNRAAAKFLAKYEDNSYSTLKRIYRSGFYTMNIAASETDSNTVYLGQVIPSKYNELSNSDDVISDIILAPSQNASDVTDFLHADIRDMKVIEVSGAERLYVGHDGGVAWGEYNSGNCASLYPQAFCWHQISDYGSSGLQTNEFYGISISKSDNLIIQGGTQDCSSFIFDELNNLWYHAYDGDGFEGAVSFNNPSHIIVGGGLNTLFYDFIDLSNPSYHAQILAGNGTFHSRAKLDPNNSGILYIGGNNLYQITDCFSSTHSDGIFSTPVISRISAFEIAYNNSLIKYIAETINQTGNSANHMWRFDPSTSSWIDISSSLSEYESSFVTDIVTNPSDDLEVWICMGQTVNENKKVFHSVNGGNQWNELSLHYPSGIPANRLLYDKVSNALYVATDVGIFRWDLYNPDSGWSYITESMPFKLVTDIERDYLNNRLIVGTHGRGIWEGVLPEDECFNESPLNITGSVSWNTSQTICQNVYVKNGGALNITAEVTLSVGATMYIESGGILTLNGGQLINGDIKVLAGGQITVLNNGIITLSQGDNFFSEVGAIVNLNYGNLNYN